MRTLVIFACSIVSAVALLTASAAAQTSPGVLSVDDGRGVLVLEIRGVVLGRLASGTIVVTDRTPRDPFEAIVSGRPGRWTEEQIGPRTVVYRGQGLRFRMAGGRYRIRVSGNGIAVAARGRGFVTLDGDPRLAGETSGLYSLTDGVDCSTAPTLCAPLPDEPLRVPLGAPPEEEDARIG